MANKIRVCPFCRTWTSEDMDKCKVCGQGLILTEYTDIFFDKISQDEQFEYVQKAIDENKDDPNVQNQSVVNTSEPTSGIGKALQVIGIIMIGLGFIVGLLLGHDQYGDVSLGLFVLYFIAGLISGMLMMGFGEIINVLFSIDKKLDKK